MKNKKMLILLALVVFVYLFRMAPIGGEIPTDFLSFYFAGTGFFGEGDIYNVNYLTELAVGSGFQGKIFPYLYPPPLALCMVFLCKLGVGRAAILWMLFSVILGVLVTVESTRLSFMLHDKWMPERNYALPLLSLFLFLILPFDNNLKMGQVNILVISFISVAVVQSLVFNRDFLAGFLLAPAILIKVTPVGLLLFFAMNKRYKTLYGCVVGVIIFIAPTLAVSRGLETWKNFLDFLSNIGYGKTIPGLFSPAALYNFSVAGCIARFTTRESVVRLETLTILAILGLVLVFQHFRLRRKGIGEFLLLPYLVLMVVGSPLTYLHHVIYIYPGLLLCTWIVLRKGGRLASVLLTCLVGLTVVASIGFPLLYGRLGVESTVLKSLNLYALLCIFVLGLFVPGLCEVTSKNT
ncbi:DUF2029 domain-containing protein [bacterium]|nr:DUF2029 domain-containing protein [bacterium]